MKLEDIAQIVGRSKWTDETEVRRLTIQATDQSEGALRQRIWKMYQDRYGVEPETVEGPLL